MTSAGEVRTRLNSSSDSGSLLHAVLAVLPFLAVYVAFVADVLQYDLDGYERVLIACALYCTELLIVVGSVHAFVSRRRPVWLATWLAFIVALVIRDGPNWIHKVSLDPYWDAVIFSCVVIAGLATMVFALRIPWWRVLGAAATMAIAGSVFFCYGTSIPFWLGFGLYLIFHLLVLGLWAMFAVGVFPRSMSGGLHGASLFLFALCILAWMPGGAYIPHHQEMAYGFAPLMGALSVWICCRSKGAWAKIGALALGAVVVGVYVPAIAFVGWIHELMEDQEAALVRPVVLLLWVIVMPTLFERRRSPRRPELAQ